MREMLMWTCNRGATNSIALHGEHVMKSRMLSVWSGYFKEKHVHNVGIYLTRRTPNKPLFGIHSGSPQSYMPHSRLHTDVDIP